MDRIGKTISRRAAVRLVAAAVIIPGFRASAAALPEVVINKNPSCRCCEAWADHLARAGFPVKIIETTNVAAIKQRLGVPDDLISCHTPVAAGYVIEGHVPASALLRLLEQKPSAIGLAVPGMPIGSPGMEGGAPETYEVVLFGSAGRRTFARFTADREVRP